MKDFKIPINKETVGFLMFDIGDFCQVILALRGSFISPDEKSSLTIYAYF